MLRGSPYTLLTLALLSSGVLAGCSEEQTQVAVPISKPENIVIAVDREGSIYWNGERVRDQAEILARLAAESTTPQKEVSPVASNVVTLEILGDGSFVWNGERVSDAETLDRYWKAAAAQNPRPEIHLKPNRDANYDSVVRALEGAQRNGLTNLGFVGNVAP